MSPSKVNVGPCFLKRKYCVMTCLYQGLMDRTKCDRVYHSFDHDISKSPQTEFSPFKRTNMTSPLISSSADTGWTQRFSSVQNATKM